MPALLTERNYRAGELELAVGPHYASLNLLSKRRGLYENNPICGLRLFICALPSALNRLYETKTIRKLVLFSFLFGGNII
jgi:hypothetical protein